MAMVKFNICSASIIRGDIITVVQEKELFEGRKISDRIVSIDRHYVRPIVRGKETKSVEFGVYNLVYQAHLFQGIQ